MTTFLEITAGEKTYEKELKDGQLSVGRGQENNIVINDPQLSAHHFVIEPVHGQYYLVDMGSDTGTFINENKVTKSILNSGDRINAGQVTFTFWQAEPVTTGAQANTEAEPSVLPMPNSPNMSNVSSMPNALVTPPPPPSSLSATTFSDVNTPSPDLQTPVVNREITNQYTSQTSQAKLSKNPSENPDSTHPSRVSPRINGLMSTLRTGKTGKINKSAEAIQQAAINHIQFLREVNNQLIDRTIQEDDITIINSHGNPMPIEAASETADSIENEKESGPILRLLLLLAMRFRATDIHIEPREERFSVRLRVDGVMVNLLNLHHSIGVRLVRVVKVLGQIDISQQNTVQEGHFASDNRKYRVHYRISYTPSLHGQKLVLRVLDVAQAPERLEDLGLPDWMLDELKHASQEDTGMLLVCGPTGSGKTSTLYSMIREVDRSTRNVVTIEDPVEYEIEDTTQLPINEVQGKTFSSMLRSVLRQDPDVLLIGEIRDADTANIAMQAAMTGHQVLSTIHAKNTIGALFRLLNLDIDRYLLATSINLIIAQRLARVLCGACRESVPATADQQKALAKYKLKTDRVNRAVGCPACLHTGYNGRKAFFEMLIANDDLRDTIMSTPQIQQIRKAIQTDDFMTLFETGYKLVEQGDTSINEIQRLMGREHR